MRYIEATVTITEPNPTLAEELIISIFHDLGLSGVLIEDPSIAYEALPPDAIVDDDGLLDISLKPKHHAVIGYFPSGANHKQKCDTLESTLADLKTSQNITTMVSYREIDEEDWAESWNAFFQPEKIGARVVIKPTWHDYDAHPGEIVVEIDPGMAFGTGTHPTTAMSIQMLETQLQPGQSVLDIGTGSGILLVSAAKLGAAWGMGIDNDVVAIAAASANLAQNRIDPNYFSVIKGNLTESVNGCFDLITANILAEVILDLIAPLGPLLVPGGCFICSGIIKSKADQVSDRLVSSGFQVIEKRQLDGWICITARFSKNHPEPSRNG